MRRQARGFSLIELMISVALLAFLVLIAGPFTSAWSNGAKVRDAEGVLNQGIGRAKAAALRNRYGIVDGKPAATLCLSDSNLLSLHEANDKDTPATCLTHSPWQAQLPASVSVTLTADASTLSCLSFDNHAAPASASVPSGCSSSTALTLAAGGENVALVFN
ncbi:prepilin-type N-terminal cleavage/methylation domain-containing protein [Pseudomonas kuykendallii]|uniref:Prepilin-type N-terminal cleavage/methylation domain-containing protein n=1 Tax=Pseudomonas kuykendallii TaxID=1007099 RepID=A0A1H2V112_9PSED|nr:prepilin-type N-terminal cleavage/methylation domain-containing protein [Pseudomonas kuykendallii]SDW62008.1 prepilin-type N-terminal cleavage/methylation domain-containing protein [Pseudomonas kuykendallii]